MEVRAISFKRRALLAGIGAVAVNAATAFFTSASLAQDIGLAQGAAPGSDRDYEKMVMEGEAALSGGEADQAASLFELAGGKRHAAPSELGLVRAWMQLGLYRRALGFLAHAAGAHLDFPAGSGLYAWLLYVGGQRDFARRTLQNALALHPGHPVLIATESLLKNPGQGLPSELLIPPVRFSPYSIGALPGEATNTGSALRISATQALAASTAIKNSSGLWLRDGRGHTAQAKLVAEFSDLELVLLETRPLSTPSPVSWATRPAFPGSSGHVLEYLATPHNQPCWPLLQVGFLGRYDEKKGYSLGIPLASSGAHGGPVLDRAGNVTGIAIRSADGENRLIPASVLRNNVAGIADAGDVNNRMLPSDEIYERACGITAQLQVVKA